MRWIIACTLVALSACEAKYPEGVLACTRASECPSGWVCRLDRLCWSSAKSGEAGTGGGLAGIGGILTR